VLFGNPSPQFLVAVAIAVVAGITVHEFSHAWVADRLGDHQPRALGRVSLDPRRHIDPLGALLFLLAGFGWGRPVPVNAYALRPGRIGLVWVAGAGPLANLALALATALVYRALLPIGADVLFALQVLYIVVSLNLILAVFNLLPIPPLDGYNLIIPLLPPRQQFWVARNARYGAYLLLGVVLVSVIGQGGPLAWLFDLVDAVARVLIGA